MKPPFTLCTRHCAHFLHCESTLDAWAAYRAKYGKPCPIEVVMSDQPCPYFTGGKRMARLPELGIVTALGHLPGQERG